MILMKGTINITFALFIELADALGRLAPSINRMTELVIFGTQPSLARRLPPSSSYVCV